jgi:hypothetical protein
VRAAAIQLEAQDTDVRGRERVGPFLRLSSIQDALSEERAQALDQLEAIVFKLERLDRWRSTSSVDLDPYTTMLRRHLNTARRRFGDPANEVEEARFVAAAFRLAQHLRGFSREPATVREPLFTIDDVRIVTG